MGKLTDILSQGAHRKPKVAAHNWTDSLAESHKAQDLPFWEETYRKAFPTMIAMHNHRDDSTYQRHGVDRSIILQTSKQILIDEKVRGRNKRTGKVYEDISLEFMSDVERNIAGWICKPLLCDFIAYAIAPLGRCYLLPTIQLQSAWKYNAKVWLREYGQVPTQSRSGTRQWTTLFCPVPVKEVFGAVGSELRFEFDPVELVD